MTLAATRRTTKLDGGAIPHQITLPVAAATRLYQGAMVCRDAAGRLVPASDTAGLSRALGFMRAEADNSAGAAGDINGDVDRGAAWFDNSGTSIVAADVGGICYCADDEAVAIAGTGNRPIAGLILDVDATLGVCVLFGEYLSRGDSESTVGAAQSLRYVRGASTANVANLAAFTVANDGITLVQGERVLLKDQAAPLANGIYVVGTVAAGTAPLTRATDADGNDEIVSGMFVHISEGTANADDWYTLTTNDPITVGTTALSFTRLPDLAQLASTANGQGAALIGIEDAAGNFTATTVEGALAETYADLASTANALGASLVGIEDAATLIAATDVEGALAENRAATNALASLAQRQVRYVMTTDVANLAAFTVLQDGVTGIEGDAVLLAAQTAGAESGVYVIGTVAAGLAPLTRHAMFPAGGSVLGGYSVAVAEGTLFADTEWFISTNGAITIDTTAHAWFPRSVTQSVVLVAGTVTVSNVPILSVTKSNCILTRQVANTSAATIQYQPTSGGATGLTAGNVGAAAAILEATVGAGTINNADISTLHCTIIN